MVVRNSQKKQKKKRGCRCSLPSQHSRCELFAKKQQQISFIYFQIEGEKVENKKAKTTATQKGTKRLLYKKTPILGKIKNEYSNNTWSKKDIKKRGLFE